MKWTGDCACDVADGAAGVKYVGGAGANNQEDQAERWCAEGGRWLLMYGRRGSRQCVLAVFARLQGR